MLSQVGTPEKVLTNICETSLVKSPFELYELENCYHGGGHGMMMNESYDLEKALAVCDLLPKKSSACWGGVFMENVMGFVAGRMPESNSRFRSDDLLAPCDEIEEKYRDSCYVYHHVYLVDVYSTSARNLVEICLGAGDHTESCLRGLVRAARDGDLEIEGAVSLVFCG